MTGVFGANAAALLIGIVEFDDVAVGVVEIGAAPGYVAPWMATERVV